MTEQQWDKKLKIRTIGRDASGSDAYRYPYEPTPYCVLERLADSGVLQKEQLVVDYGCGLGRVGFFLHHRVGCRCIGVEYDPRIYEKAVANNKTYVNKKGVEFVCTAAERYDPGGADAFYFFNPFSMEVLRSVYGCILRAWYQDPKRRLLLFYYPGDDCRSWLMTGSELRFAGEVDCSDLFPGQNSRETVLIFALE